MFLVECSILLNRIVGYDETTEFRGAQASKSLSYLTRGRPTDLVGETMIKSSKTMFHLQNLKVL